MAEGRAAGGGLSGAGLRDLLTSGIAGLESVPAVRAEPVRSTPPVGHMARPSLGAPPTATMPMIDHFLYRGLAALAAARQLAARLAEATHPPAPAELDELRDLLRLADEG